MWRIVHKLLAKNASSNGRSVGNRVTEFINGRAAGHKARHGGPAALIINTYVLLKRSSGYAIADQPCSIINSAKKLESSA
jgi:hypothetical protein